LNGNLLFDFREMGESRTSPFPASTRKKSSSLSLGSTAAYFLRREVEKSTHPQAVTSKRNEDAVLPINSTHPRTIAIDRFLSRTI
jgi:hypothetical protein